jgi:hypothetical protein
MAVKHFVGWSLDAPDPDCVFENTGQAQTVTGPEPTRPIAAE